METSGVMVNRALVRLRKVPQRGNTKWTTHPQSEPLSPECSGTYRSKTKKSLDKRKNKRSDMVLYVLQSAILQRYNGVNAGTSDILTMNSNTRIAATQCSLGTWFVSGI
jgi:hypothetical protein